MDELTNGIAFEARLEPSTDPSSTPVIKLVGELDLASVPALRAVIDPVIEEKPEKVTFDLSRLRFMDSSGITVLLSVVEQVAIVELREPLPMIRKIIDLTGLSSVFLVVP